MLRQQDVPQFPNPWDHKSFLTCTSVNVFERMQCPLGTFFSEDIRHCVPEGFNPPKCPQGQCLNDADCLVDANNKPQCVCRKGFTGERCETNIDECATLGGSRTCNGGTCVDQINGFYCKCPGDLVGLNCHDTIANPCTEDNLQRDNVFHTLPSQLQNTYLHCTGPMQLTVSRCADNLFWHVHEHTCSVEPAPLRQAGGVCATQQPCKNGGECQESGGSGDFVCQCRNGFEGKLCERMIDHCTSNPCQNGGRCLSFAGGHSCICADKIIDRKFFFSRVINYVNFFIKYETHGRVGGSFKGFFK